jgi:hypothetical protein
MNAKVAPILRSGSIDKRSKQMDQEGAKESR